MEHVARLLHFTDTEAAKMNKAWCFYSRRPFQMAVVVKNPSAGAGDVRLRFSPWVRKIPGEGHGHPLQNSCLENSTDRGT